MRPLASNWESIAHHLVPPLRDGAIGEIKLDNSGKPDQAQHCLREMIVQWLKRISPCKPSWQRLKEAITDAGIEHEEIMIEIDKHI